MWLVLSHQEPQTQYKSEIKEKTLSRQESLDGLRISQKSAKTPLFTEFSDGLGWGLEKITVNCESVNGGCILAVEISVIAYPNHRNS